MEDKEIKQRQGKKLFIEDIEAQKLMNSQENADSVNNVMQDEGFYMNGHQNQQSFFDSEPNYMGFLSFLSFFIVFYHFYHFYHFLSFLSFLSFFIIFLSFLSFFSLVNEDEFIKNEIYNDFIMDMEDHNYDFLRNDDRDN